MGMRGQQPPQVPTSTLPHQIALQNQSHMASFNTQNHGFVSALGRAVLSC